MMINIDRMILKLISRVDELEERIEFLEHENEKNYSEKPIERQRSVVSLETEIKCNNDVKMIFKILSAKDMLSEQDIKNFCDEEWCRSNFHISFAVLRKEEKGRLDKRGYPRYWNDKFVFYGEKYFCSSQWYEFNRKYLQNRVRLKSK